MQKTTKMPTEAPWTTMTRNRWADGRIQGVDGSMWLVRAIPLGPVDDARSEELSGAMAEPLMAAFGELATLTGPIRMTRRATAKGAYRDFKLLLTNMPDWFRPASPFLARAFPNTIVQRRVALLAVRLVSKVGEGGWRSAVDSVVETFLYGGTAVEEFNADAAEVAAALDRCGLRKPSEEEMRLASAWWNRGEMPDVPYLVHADHLHLFRKVAGAQQAARMIEAGSPCDDWPESPDTHTLSFATLTGLDTQFVNALSPAARWVSRLVEAGAVAISMTGKVEPAQVTRDELRRMLKRYQDDLQERYREGKMNRAEQEETERQLAEVEAFYATGGTPTLMEMSTIVAFSGRHERAGYDPTEIGRACGVQLAPMVNLQTRALAETMLASHVRANPHVRDFPCQTVAYSGLPSLSVAGDRDGALVGFTERDKQPAYLAAMAATDADSLPLAFILGATGSGKALALSTPIPTPAGTTTMGALQVGDQVLGRDGKPCRVTFVSPVNSSPRLYRMTLSDGQTIVADYDHQWVVAPSNLRNRTRRPNHVAAMARRAGFLPAAAHLYEVAETLGEDVYVRTEELWQNLDGWQVPWLNPGGLRAALSLLDCPSRMVQVPVVRSGSTLVKVDPVVLYPVKESMRVLAQHWSQLSGANAVRWGEQARARARAAELVAESAAGTDEATLPEMMRSLVATGEPVGVLHGSSNQLLREPLRRAGTTSRRGFATVTVPVPDRFASHTAARLWHARSAMRMLADRITHLHAETASLEPGETVMTTGEMLAAGVLGAEGRASFAIRTTGPLDLPETELPVDPYAFGAWLGDGDSRQGAITSMDHQIVDQIVAGGFPLRRVDEAKNSGKASRYVFGGLWQALREAGLHDAPVKGSRKLDKRIPEKYLRASTSQRLALLQGLMDTDGTITRSGNCELALSKADLAMDALELIRSLGVKASMSVNDAAMTVTDRETGRRSRKNCGSRYRIKFTTDIEMFRLDRKRALLPTSVRETQGWLYITDIQPIEPGEPGYEAARCIQVDSPDSTYLAGGMVPTHNTQAGLWLCDQFARERNSRGEHRPVMFFDPKTGSDFSRIVQRSGGQVYSLDTLASADGVFDAIRFCPTREVGVEMASSMLMQVNPWGPNKALWEAPLLRALNYGVNTAGATCTMQALELAERAGFAEPEMVKAVRDVADASPMFRALCGRDPQGQSLAMAEGITYIKVGQAHLDLPAPGVTPEQMSLSQRVSTALVRAVAYGSMMAMTGRDGVMMLDEFWVFTTAGATEMERIGRLARSQRVFPIGLTQRVTDALNIGLAGYISRGLILPIEDKVEAVAACELFRLDPTPERIGRITAKGTLGDGTSESEAPNWNSMRHLRDPRTREVLRGSIGIYCDLLGRAVPVEVRLPAEWLADSSTNRLDIEARLAASKQSAALVAPAVSSRDELARAW